MMQLSEKELEQLIRSVPSIGPYHAGAGEAARLVAEKLAEGAAWQESFELDEAGHIWVRAQSGYSESGEGYWLDDFWAPGQRVTVTVTKEE